MPARSPHRVFRLLWVVCALSATMACLVATTPSASAAITSCPGTGAAFAGGSGTTADPFLVATADQLAQIQGPYLQCSFEQSANISLGGRNWAPIGPGSAGPKGATQFTGEFDGGGFAITNMSIISTAATAAPSGIGLFGSVSSARISGVEVSGSITVSYSTPGTPLLGVGGIGGLIGTVVGATPGTVISDVTANVSIDVVTSFGNGPQPWYPGCMCAQTSGIGGLIGATPYGTAISLAHATGDVSVTQACALVSASGGTKGIDCDLSGVGGLVGSNSASSWPASATTFEQVTATGAVSASLSCSGDASTGGACVVGDVGGLLGGSTSAPATIADARATGTVSVTCAGQCTGTYGTGGLVGEAANTTILRGHAAGGASVACPNGIVGGRPCATASGALAGRINGGSVGQSYAASAATQGGLQAGGLMGLSQGASVSDSFARSAIVPTTVDTLASAGGLVGSLQNSAVVQRSYATGQVNAGTPATAVGGLVGSVVSSGSVIANATWSTDATGQSVSAGGGTARTTAQMVDATTYGPAGFAWPIVQGWQQPSAVSTWGICAAANGGYPFLLWAYASSPCGPDAPTLVTPVLPGSTQATVRWTAPVNDGGSPVTSYTAEAVTAGSPSCTATAPATSCTITGLANGTSYNVRVKAFNANGASDWSSTASVTPGAVTRPGAPTAITATVPFPVVPGAVDVSWTAPVDMGGGASIASYTAVASPGGATCTSSTGTPVTPSCRVTGLTDGTQYTFTVTAVNNVSVSSLPSDTSNSVRPGAWTVPGAPTGVAGAAGDTMADIAWAAPANPGGTGATIIGYQATASPGGRTCVSAGSVRSCRMVGLDDGTPYTFTVTATNAVGTGAASAASAPVTPRLETVPDPPLGAIATAGSRAATVAWRAPVDDGGAPVSRYMATATPGGGTCLAAAGSTACTVSGLTNGTAYTFTVTATNANGTSSASEPSDPVTPQEAVVPGAPPATVPGAPTTVTATAGNGRAAITWNAPATDGGTAITGYTVTGTPGGRTCTAAGSTCTITGLANGTAYTFTAVATNAVGNSAASAPSAPVTPIVPLGTITGTRRTSMGSRARITGTLTAGRTGSYTVTLVRRTGRTQPLLPGSRVGDVRTMARSTASVTLKMSAGRRYPLALLVAKSAPAGLNLRLAWAQTPGAVQRQSVPIGAPQA